MNHQFSGTGVAIVTPFNNDLTIDFDSFGKVIDHVVDNKIEYIVALGTTGESVTLNKEEKKEVVRYCVEKINNRVPLVVGIGGNHTQEVVENIKSQDYNGVSGVLSVSPYYNKPSQNGIYEHFKAIADVCPKPVIIYNVPGRTGSNIQATTTIKIAADCKNVVAIKEASGDLCQVMQIIKNKPSGFEVISGDDALAYSIVNLGGKGVISVIANSHPLQYGNMIRHCLGNNLEEAQRIQYELIDYMEALFAEGSPTGIKTALSIMGLCNDTVRPPITTSSVNLRQTITNLVEKIG